MGADVTVGDPGLAAHAADFRTRNVGLIRMLSEDYIARMRQILDDSGVRTRHEGIAADLIEATGITKRHAALVARDQVLKYNANVTRARHEDAGITSYTWRTSEDERVREDHQALDGEVFEYADPAVQDEATGETGNPGKGIQCRCTADPIIPGFDDDGGDEPEDSTGSEGGDSDDTDDVPTPDADSPDDAQDPDAGGTPPSDPPDEPPPDDGLPPEPPGGDGPNRSEMDPPGGIEGQPPPWHTDNLPRPPGKLDESERVEEPRARPAIDTLIAQGNDVKTLPVVQNRGRNGDTIVNGVRTELKRLDSARPDAIANRINKSKKGTGQAPNIVIDARGHGMTRDEVDQGIEMQRPHCNGKIHYVRVIADDFDVTYSRFR